MNAQEELENILIDEAKIEGKEEQLIRLESQAMKMTAAMDGETVSRSRNDDPLGTYMKQKEKLESEIAKLREENERRKALLSGIIDGLRKPVYIKILYGHYFNGKSFKKLSNETVYSYRHLQNLKDDAVKAVQKMLDSGKISI